MSGTLPSSLLGMPRLRYMLLANNRLTGPIPRDWFQLAQMEILEVTLRACLILPCCPSLGVLSSGVQALLDALCCLVTWVLPIMSFLCILPCWSCH